jgi:hypothetical protein
MLCGCYGVTQIDHSREFYRKDRIDSTEKNGNRHFIDVARPHRGALGSGPAAAGSKRLAVRRKSAMGSKLQMCPAPDRSRHQRSDGDCAFRLGTPVASR